MCYDPMYRKIKESAWDVENGTVASEKALAWVEYTYEKDRLDSVATPTTTYSFQYNEFSQRTTVLVGDRELASYTFSDDKNRQLLSLDFGNEDFVQYTYDEDGRVTKLKYEDNDTVTYTYDNAGTFATVTDSSSGISSAVIYDYQDRLSRYTETGGAHDLLVRYKYDSEDRVSAILYMVDNVMGKAHNSTFTYDSKDRIETYRKGNGKIAYTYDLFGRKTSTSLTHSGGDILSTTYGFAGTEDGQISNRVASLTKDAPGYDITYHYEYDQRGNITKVSEVTGTEDNAVTVTTTYTYDSLNQLIREDNEAEDFIFVWEYYDGGNIKNRKKYDYNDANHQATTEYLVENAESLENIDYTYQTDDNKEDAVGVWGDLLTSYGDMPITYDAIGNPLTMGQWRFQWEHGRELDSMYTVTNELDKDGNPVIDTRWNFTYNADGLRTKRTNGTLTYDYVYYGGQLMYMMVKDTGAQSPTKGNHHFILSYTPEGIPMGITYQGTAYYYLTNLQGDVVAILNNKGHRIISYTYDAWGNLLSTVVHVAENDKDYAANYAKYSTIAAFNPLRYRGYVYDTETGLYYLQSRYYNPEIGRFLNADGYTSTMQGFTGNNMFAYCGNNPVNRYDHSGYFWQWVAVAVKAVVTVAVVAVTAVIIIAAVTMPSKEEHYARNDNQKDLIPDNPKEITGNEEDWIKQPDDRNIYHRHTKGEQGEDAANNVKYMSSDGHLEVIICNPGTENAYIVTDPYNYGTYNFGTNDFCHFFKDVLPYWLWGNSPEDSGWGHAWDRIRGAK